VIAMPDLASPARPLRKDAADNRERLLAAARTIFGRDGVDVGIEHVAREAGLGMGTVYRRFPTKQALIDELMNDMVADMASLAESSLAAGAADGTGLERYLHAVGGLMFERRGFLPMVWRSERPTPTVLRLRTIYAGLLAQGQRHGTLGRGLASSDITIAIWSLRGVMETTYAAAPHAWRRHLDLVLAGMRTAGAEFETPALTAADLDRAATRTR